MHHDIIDVTDGRIVADTKDLGVKYVNRRYVAPSLNGIIFSGVDNKGLALVMIDASTGKKLWTLQNIFDSNSELLTAKPLAVDGEHIMLSTTKRVYKINTASGNVVWKSDYQTSADKLGLQTENEGESDGQASTKDGEKKGGGLMGMASKVPGVGGFAALGRMGSEMRNGAAKAADVVYGKFLVLDNAPGIVYYYNTRSSVSSKIIRSDLTILKVNKALCELLGYAAHEIEGTKILDHACEEHIAHWHRLQEEIWAKKVPFFKLEACLYRKDHSRVWVDVTTILYNDQVETFGFTVLDDISGLKKYEESFDLLYSIFKKHINNPPL